MCLCGWVSGWCVFVWVGEWVVCLCGWVSGWCVCVGGWVNGGVCLCGWVGEWVVCVCVGG